MAAIAPSVRSGRAEVAVQPGVEVGRPGARRCGVGIDVAGRGGQLRGQLPRGGRAVGDVVGDREPGPLHGLGGLLEQCDDLVGGAAQGRPPRSATSSADGPDQRSQSVPASSAQGAVPGAHPVRRGTAGPRRRRRGPRSARRAGRCGGPRRPAASTGGAGRPAGPAGRRGRAGRPTTVSTAPSAAARSASESSTPRSDEPSGGRHGVQRGRGRAARSPVPRTPRHAAQRPLPTSGSTRAGPPRVLPTRRRRRTAPADPAVASQDAVATRPARRSATSRATSSRRRLDHDAHQLLGARGPQQHPSAARERRLLGGDGLGHLGRGADGGLVVRPAR